jgi:hypothetical protein
MDVDGGSDNEPAENGSDDDDFMMQGLTTTHAVSGSPSRASSTGLSGLSCPSDFIYPYRTHGAVPPAPRKIRLLYVPDPSRGKDTREEASIDLGWVRRHLTPDQLNAIRGLNGMQYKASRQTKQERNASGTLMLVTEWVGNNL